MKNIKKIWALLLTGILTVSLCSISTFAADPAGVEVTLKSSKAPAVNGEIYEVTLCVSEQTIGGVQGTLTYDSSLFRLNESGAVTVSSAFAEANRLSENEKTTMINDNTNGTIKFALLSDGTSTNWVTFNFLVLGTEGKADFKLSDVKVSNADGTKKIASVTTGDLIDVSVYDHAININGASVRTDGTADIRFEMELDTTYTGKAVKKIGFILIPTNFLGDGELTVDNNATYSGYKAAIGERDVKSDDTKVYVNLIHSSTKKNLNTKYTARAYVRLEDGAVIYSDNVVAKNNIDNGMSSRSCVDVARAVAISKGIQDVSNIKTILDKTTWTVEDYNTVINGNNEYSK